MPRARRRPWAGLAALLVSLGLALSARAQIPSPLGSPLSFYSIGPCRIFDTRTGAQGGTLVTNTPEPPPPATPTASSVSRALKIRGQCQIPAEAQALTYNLTLVGQPYAGHLTLYSGNVVPNASSLNFVANQTTANGGVVQLGDTTQDRDLVAKLVLGSAPIGSRADIILDATGYFAQ
jgi:hypothetical protein